MSRTTMEITRVDGLRELREHLDGLTDEQLEEMLDILSPKLYNFTLVSNYGSSWNHKYSKIKRIV